MDSQDEKSADERRPENLRKMFPNDSAENLELVNSFFTAARDLINENREAIIAAEEAELERIERERAKSNRNRVVPIVVLRKCNSLANFDAYGDYDMLAVLADIVQTLQMSHFGEGRWMHMDAGIHNSFFYREADGSARGLLIGWESAAQGPSISVYDHRNPRPPNMSFPTDRSFAGGFAEWLRSNARRKEEATNKAQPSASSDN